MTDKKLTDNEIIKALDESEVFLRNRVKDGQPIKLNECDVGILRNISQVCAKAYDEIDRLQTENKNLKVENQSLRSAANSLKMHYEEAQAEIESLKIFRGYAEKRASDYKTMRDKYLNAKTEAYKEFAETVIDRVEKAKVKYQRLCKEQGEEMEEHMHIHFNGIIGIINNLLKELVGDDNA